MKHVKIPKSMTLIFLTVGFICTALAAILQYKENEKSSNKIIRLQDQLLMYTTGGKELPAIVMLHGINQIALEIVTRDTFPIVNVKIKCRGVVLPDVGTVYPNVTTRFYEAIIPPDLDSVNLDLIIWYNNTKSLMANVTVTRQQNGLLESRIEYLNSKGEVIDHPYQGKGIPLRGDSSNKGYRPNLHF